MAISVRAGRVCVPNGSVIMFEAGVGGWNNAGWVASPRESAAALDSLLFRRMGDASHVDISIASWNGMGGRVRSP